MTHSAHDDPQDLEFTGSRNEALSYLNDTGPWSCRVATPSPGIHLAGGLLLLAIGGWAGLATAGHSVVLGVLVLALTALVAGTDLLPAAWTLSHRPYARRYLAARLTYGRRRARLHPAVVLVAFPALCFLAMSVGGPGDDTGTQLLWGLLGALTGLVLGCLRVLYAQRLVSPSGSADPAERVVVRPGTVRTHV